MFPEFSRDSGPPRAGAFNPSGDDKLCLFKNAVLMRRSETVAGGG
jgi:hypothetical protein